MDSLDNFVLMSIENLEFQMIKLRDDFISTMILY
jgi:hypothetical protein